jgi:hypothetical protein
MRGEVTSKIKYFSFRDIYIKSNTLRDLEKEKEKAIKNVRLVLRTSIITRSGKRKFVTNVHFLRISLAGRLAELA